MMIRTNKYNSPQEQIPVHIMHLSNDAYRDIESPRVPKIIKNTQKVSNLQSLSSLSSKCSESALKRAGLIDDEEILFAGVQEQVKSEVHMKNFERAMDRHSINLSKVIANRIEKSDKLISDQNIKTV